jgi:molecular chaperone DnaJ
MGDVGPHGGPAGDLIVLIEEKPHPVFDRDGSDLLLDVPVTYPTAVLGGKTELPTLDGKPAVLEIPSGSASGRTLRLRGRGLPGLRGGRGDLVARIVIWVPARVQGSERKVLEELQRQEGFQPPKPGKSLFERVKDAFTG